MRPAILDKVFAPITALKGVGDKQAKTLTKLLGAPENQKQARVIDLLFHLPYSAIDRRNSPKIALAKDGEIVTVEIWVDQHKLPPHRMRHIPYIVKVHDETASLDLVFFHAYGNWIERQLPIGERRIVSGRVDLYQHRLRMVHPDYIVEPENTYQLPKIQAVYPSTAGLGQKQLSKAISQAVSLLPNWPEWIADNVIDAHQWLSFKKSLTHIHRPSEISDAAPGSSNWHRLAYDELLAHQISLLMVRGQMFREEGISHKGDGILCAQIKANLPYTLTSWQEQALDEIYGDLASSSRMLRLLQGDVGSGKTIVALLAMARVVDGGHQAVLMAPTDILARQHYDTIRALLPAEKQQKFALLTGKDKASEKKAVLAELKSGSIEILVGTHAVFQESVQFASLGLVVVDEQHRFGVHQRLALAEKGKHSDVLVMTATPIPRTLQLAMFGDMSVSKISGKPKERKEIITRVISASRIDEIVERARQRICEGRQVYWVCPLVEESDILNLTSAEDRFSHLQNALSFPVGLIHGKQKLADRERVIQQFREGVLKLLVATTVIEVGVDVPAATIMVIENAERFGLAQLHQLRGRVGRGHEQSFCILAHGENLSEVARKRLNVMRQTNDGFVIAEEDLKLRGSGELLGFRQSGTENFRFADLSQHFNLLQEATSAAREIYAKNPSLQGDEGARLTLLLYLFGKQEAVKLIGAG